MNLLSLSEDDRLKASAGHVDIYHNGHWGSVCDDGWDLDEAQVVCRQMGFSGAIEFRCSLLMSVLVAEPNQTVTDEHRTDSMMAE